VRVASGTWLCGSEQGYAGLELSVGDALAASGGDSAWRPLVSALSDHDLSVIMGVYTSWSDYNGPKEFVDMGTHKDRLRREVGVDIGLGGYQWGSNGRRDWVVRVRLSHMCRGTGGVGSEASAQATRPVQRA
jgi:hypothetical protein